MKDSVRNTLKLILVVTMCAAFLMIGVKITFFTHDQELIHVYLVEILAIISALVAVFWPRDNSE